MSNRFDPDVKDREILRAIEPRIISVMPLPFLKLLDKDGKILRSFSRAIVKALREEGLIK